MTSLTGQVPSQVRSAIKRYAVHEALVLIGTRLSAAMALAVLVFLVTVGADRLAEWPLWLRVMGVVLCAGVIVVGVIAALAAIVRANDRQRMAIEIDRAVPGSRDLLSSVLDFQSRQAQQPGTIHPYMLDTTTDQAIQLAGRVEPSRLYGWRRLPVMLMTLILLAGLTAGLWAVPAMCMPLLVRRFFNPTGNFPLPSMTLIQVAAVPARVTEGADVPVTIELAGRVPDDPQVTLFLHQGSIAQPIPMTPRGSRKFEAVLRGLESQSSFFITAGDGKTARYDVAVEPRPRITRMTAQYTFPGYSRLGKKTEEVQFGEIRALEGTRVRIDIETSLPIKDSAVVFPERRLKINWDRAATKGNFQFTIDKETTLKLALTAQSGADNGPGAGYRVRMVPDNPPTISLLDVPTDLTFSLEDVLRLGYRGTDDLGISEVFLRFKGRGSQNKSLSVPMNQAQSREVVGELQVEIHDLAEDDETGLEVELVMADTKGQEAASQKLKLAIVSDTLDRQLADLAAFHERLRTQINAHAGALTSVTGRLDTLIEGMDDKLALEGKRLEMFDALARELSALRTPNYVRDQGQARLFSLTEYPDRLGRATETLAAESSALADGGEYGRRMTAVRGQPGPGVRAKLVEMRAYIEAQRAFAAALRQAAGDVALETQLDLLQVLTDLHEAGQLDGKRSTEATSLTQQRQDQRVTLIAQTLTKAQGGVEAANDAPLLDAIKSLTTAQSAPVGERDKATAAAMVKLRDGLRRTPLLDGRLGASLQVMGAASKPHDRLERATTPEELYRVTTMLCGRLRMRRDDLAANTIELLLWADLYEAAATGDAARKAAAIARSRQAEPLVQRSDALNRLMLLRTGLRQMRIDMTTGRLSPTSVAFDMAWQEQRERASALMRDVRCGALSLLDDPSRALIMKIEAQAQAIQPSSGQLLARQTDASALFDGLLPLLDQAIVALWAQVEPEARRVATEADQTLRDLATNMGLLSDQLSAERQKIAAEVIAAGGIDPARQVKGRELIAKTPGSASNERWAFSYHLHESIACHAIALAQIADLREWVWARAPDPVVAVDVQAVGVLAEFLAHLEETSYDESLGVFMLHQIGQRPYPAFLTAISDYYELLAGDIRRAAGWTQTSTTARAGELLKVEEFAKLLARVNKLPRLLESQRSMRRHADFAALLAASAAPAAARDAVLAMPSQQGAGGGQGGPAYWDHAVVALKSLAGQLESAASKPIAPTVAATAPAVAPSAAWTGVSDEKSNTVKAALAAVNAIVPSAAQIAALTPTTRPAASQPDGAFGDESRRLLEVLATVPAALDRAAVSKLAGAGAGATDAALDDLNRVHGELLGAITNLESKTASPAVVIKPRPRYAGRVRHDLMWIEGRLMRNEMRWTQRSADAVRRAWSARAAALLAGGPAASVAAVAAPEPARMIEAWLSAQEGITRRKSAAALAQRSRALGLDNDDIDPSLLKMPKHLYDELTRASAKPYPEQFKQPAVKYMEGLVRDSR